MFLTPTVSFTIATCPSSEAAKKLSDKGLFLSHGDFYAATVVERLGLVDEGLLRAGCACYTTEEEIDRLLRASRNWPTVDVRSELALLLVCRLVRHACKRDARSFVRVSGFYSSKQ
jgi:hypothetical protein